MDGRDFHAVDAIQSEGDANPRIDSAKQSQPVNYITSDDSDNDEIINQSTSNVTNLSGANGTSTSNPSNLAANGTSISNPSNLADTNGTSNVVDLVNKSLTLNAHKSEENKKSNVDDSKYHDSDEDKKPINLDSDGDVKPDDLDEVKKYNNIETDYKKSDHSDEDKKSTTAINNFTDDKKFNSDKDNTKSPTLNDSKISCAQTTTRKRKMCPPPCVTNLCDTAPTSSDIVYKKQKFKKYMYNSSNAQQLQNNTASTSNILSDPCDSTTSNDIKNLNETNLSSIPPKHARNPRCNPSTSCDSSTSSSVKKSHDTSSQRPQPHDATEHDSDESNSSASQNKISSSNEDTLESDNETNISPQQPPGNTETTTADNNSTPASPSPTKSSGDTESDATKKFLQEFYYNNSDTDDEIEGACCPSSSSEDGNSEADDNHIDSEENKRMMKRPQESPASTRGSGNMEFGINVIQTTQQPELKSWLQRFSDWSNAEKLHAIDALISRSPAGQVRHMLMSIEPLFQRDFISLLPKELALTVLGYLEARDLFRAAQTCRYWRFLADDNLLWREQCHRIGITSLKKKTRRSPFSESPWKATYMGQHIIESNWESRPIDELIVLKGHDDHVITCLQFYGNRIVSGSDDTTLKVWSATTGRCLKTLVGHSGGVWSSQMHGHLVISGSTDRTLRVWNAKTGVCLKVLAGHTSTVRCMHLHRDKVVSGSRDATLRLWSIPEGRCIRTLLGHQAAVRCVQFDGKVIVSGAYDFFIKIWNPDTGECLHTLAGHTNRVYSLQFDGVHVVSGSLDTSIRVWDVETGQLKHTLIGHQSLTSGMELDGNILVSGNADSTVKVWDIATGHCLHTLSGPNKHQSAVTSLQANKRFVVTSSDDGTVKLWDLRTGEFIRNLVELESGGSGGVVWRIRVSDTKLVCAVGSRIGTEETKVLVLNFGIPMTCHKCT